MDIADLSECDVLALITVVTNEFMDAIRSADDLSFWGDFLTALGTNLIMLADQRMRIENKKTAVPTKSTAVESENKTDYCPK